MSGPRRQSLVRRFVQSGGGDFVRRIALELPMRIIAHLLGIEQEPVGGV